MPDAVEPASRPADRLSPAPGVYISYPFCNQKCTYCNFASGVFPRDLERRYMTALAAEIRAHQWQCAPATLYLGGGTPSLMDIERLPLAREWREATIEAAPGSTKPERVAAWRRAGINRVSLGVQSFIPSEVARTGRQHTPAVVASEVELLRAAGIDNISIDLIAGLPGQTADSWRESLEWLARLDVPHASVYMLEVDEDSRLGKEILSGGVRYGARDVPCDDLIAEFYETAVEFLAALGLARYEISNFARPGCESRHNLKYWRLEPYVGCGADAHSYDGVTRWQNVESAADYVDRMERGLSPIAERSPAHALEERFYVGLRLVEGIQADWRPFEQPVRRFLAQGLLETDGPRLRLTPRGILLANEVLAEFVIA